MRRFVPGIAALAAASVAAVTLATPREAAACGGFFCNQSQPVDQAGEQILFTHDENQDLVVYVQVRYQGPSQDFSWVLPVPGLPTVGVGTDALFTRLQQTTTPAFQLEYREEGVCSDPWDEADGGFGGASAGGGGQGGGNGGGGVTILAQQQVGPYDQVTLGSDDATALVQWLADNDYDLPPGAEELIRLYVDGEHTFVAVKLQQDKGVGDLVPLVLRFDEAFPCVPLRLTAVAATPNMPLTAWILADRRAVPENYFHVGVNEARINWFSGGANYAEVVAEAVDAAPNGQAFVTDFAGPMTTVTAGNPMVPFGWNEAQLAATGSWYELFDGLMGQGFAGDAALLGWFTRNLPPPPGDDPQSFYNCLRCSSEYVDAQPFDAAALAADLDATLVEPLREADELFASQPYVTRLFTTMDAAEMTTDPTFLFNTGLPDVPRVRTATAVLECGLGADYYSAPVRLELADGRVIRYEGGLNEAWQGTSVDVSEAGPAALYVEQLGAEGMGEIIEDRRDGLRPCIGDCAPGGGPGNGGGGTGGGAGSAGALGGGGNCAGCQTGSGVEVAGLALGLLALALRRRR